MSLDKLRLHELRAATTNADCLAPAVSGWSVGMHVQHTCLSMLRICRALAESTPPPPRQGFSMTTWVVFATGRIPRGRGKAPREAVPAPGVTRNELLALLDSSERAIASTLTLDPGAWFEHFVFGVLHRDRAIRLIEIHNRHHLRIVADVVAARQLQKSTFPGNGN